MLSVYWQSPAVARRDLRGGLSIPWGDAHDPKGN